MILLHATIEIWNIRYVTILVYGYYMRKHTSNLIAKEKSWNASHREIAGLNKKNKCVNNKEWVHLIGSPCKVFILKLRGSLYKGWKLVFEDCYKIILGSWVSDGGWLLSFCLILVASWWETAHILLFKQPYPL